MPMTPVYNEGLLYILNATCTKINFENSIIYSNMAFSIKLSAFGMQGCNTSLGAILKNSAMVCCYQNYYCTELCEYLTLTNFPFGSYSKTFRITNFYISTNVTNGFQAMWYTLQCHCSQISKPLMLQASKIIIIHFIADPVT